jgi:peptidoglycan/xylan/chitin deacetylase (PgdA/CDA1 family)|tara:strand:- start:233 stop:1102 length:870 start_codon:yes stop_codon:yes gene_type:complete
MQIFKDRVPYSAIVDRPPLKLPNGKRMAVWFIANVEDWDISRPMPRTVLPPPMGVPLLPDLPNWSWHEYGMRVGFWRIAEAFQKYGVRPTMAVNGRVCENYPRIAEEALKLDWEFMGHGHLQGPMHKHDDQQEQIDRACEAIKKFSGKKVRGWESPGLTETFNTIDYLARAGIEYVADWVLDDQPIKISTTEGSVISVPYTVETNDITMMALQQHPSSEMFNRSKDQFDRLYIESANSTRIMSVSLHMYLTGAPHRIKYLEEFIEYIQSHDECVIMTGEEILDWYNTTL